MSQADPPLLDYGRYDALRRQRTRRRLIAVVVIISLLGGAYMQWSEPLKARYAEFMFLRRQNSLRNDVEPCDVIVYSDEPVQISRLRGTTIYGMPQHPIPALLANVAVGPQYILRSHNYYSDLWNQAYVDEVFRGSRFTPNGIERILGTNVMVENYGEHGRLLMLNTTTMTVRTALGQPSKVQAEPFEILLKPTDHITIFAGQRDPNDASRFLIPYQLNGVPGIFEGKLLSITIVKMSVIDGFAEVPSFAWRQAMATLSQQQFGVVPDDRRPRRH